MLQVKLLGTFDVRLDDKPVVIPSRAAQSLFAYLLLNAGNVHRREKLAGLFWPETSDANARGNLRHDMWRLRKAIEGGEAPRRNYFLADEFSIAFDAQAEYWLDVMVLERKFEDGESITDWINALAVYHGDLLPGFYDDWVVLERQRLQAVVEDKFGRLLERLVAGQNWTEVLEWSERWIALGLVSEAPYRALMFAYSALGDSSKVAATFQRCVDSLAIDLGVEPSEQTRAVYQRLQAKDETWTPVYHTSFLPHSSTSDESPAPGEAPFKGLQYFDEADAALFFGREPMVARLVERLREQPMLAVVGGSGSGKSSLVRAGLVPALNRGSAANRVAPMADGALSPEGSIPWETHVITPTAYPLQALAASLTRDSHAVTLTESLVNEFSRDPRSLAFAVQRARAQRPASRMLLIVDQFEELFTMCRDEFEREAFIDNLLTAVAPLTVESGSAGGVGMTLVIALRADFYAHCAQYENLREALAKNQEYIGPMNPEELRRAIQEPAIRGGWQFEPGLVELLLREVGDEPGALPLLSHALLETWKHRQGRALTLKGYALSGEVRGAIAQTAETVYQQLSREEQVIARRIFLRLTELGEGTSESGLPSPDTRRRANLSELQAGIGDSSDRTASVLKRLADARLTTIEAETAEVAHEALIREWPRLRDWLDENREGLRLHRHLTQQAQAWERLAEDPSELYRGTRLAQALEWANANAAELNALELNFLQTSKNAAGREQAERAALSERELAAARKLADTERQRAEEQARTAMKLRQRALYLAGAFIVALVMAGAAIFFGNQATNTAGRNAALAAKSAQDARLARSREWAAAAINNLSTDPERSILLGLQAVSETYAADKTVVPEAFDALERAVQSSRVLFARGQPPHTDPDLPLGIVFSPDGSRFVMTLFDGTRKIFDATSGQLLFTLPGQKTWPMIDSDFSQDGARLITLDPGKGNTTMITTWGFAADRADATPLLSTTLAISPKEITVISTNADLVTRNAFSRDLTRVATGMTDGTTKVWDTDSGKLLQTLSGHTAMISQVAFSPDGSRLVTGSYDATAKVWDVASGKLLQTLSGHRGAILGVAFSSDGMQVATAGFDSTAKVWDVSNGQERFTLYGHTSKITGIAFSPDGTRLATGSIDRNAKVWDVATGRELFTLSGHADQVYNLVFSPDGTRLATTSYDGTVRMWAATAGKEQLTFSGHTDGILNLALSRDGTHLATASQDKSAKLWDTASGKLLHTFAGHTGLVFGIALSPDGTRLVTGSDDQTAKVWDTVTGNELFTLSAHKGRIYNVAFSPDGTRIMTASTDRTAKLWDAATGKELLTLTGHEGEIHQAVFSPDGTRIATASADRTVRLWDAITGKQLLSLSGHNNSIWDVRFSPDGSRLATASRDNSAKVWDATTGKELVTLSGHTNTITTVAFSPDGTQLATTSFDSTIKVWNATTGEELLSLSGSGAVAGLAFSPDGSQLYAGNGDGTVRVYLLRIEELVSLARARLTRSWTLAECQTFLHREDCPK